MRCSFVWTSGGYQHRLPRVRASNTAHDVQIALWRDDRVLYAEVTDDGRPIRSPFVHEPPVAPRGPSVCQDRGLWASDSIRGFADQIIYQRSGPLNRLLLSFRVN